MRPGENQGGLAAGDNDVGPERALGLKLGWRMSESSKWAASCGSVAVVLRGLCGRRQLLCAWITVGLRGKNSARTGLSGLPERTKLPLWAVFHFEQAWARFNGATAFQLWIQDPTAASDAIVT